MTQSWSLSLVGDWNSVTTNGTPQARTYGPSHELLTGASQNVTTDVKGNITLIPAALRSNGVALAMTWDFDNRLASAVTGSTTVSHKYDALGRRVARTEGSATTVYAQSGQQTLCDYVAGAAPTASTYRYLFASYIDEPVLRITTTGSVATYFHRNQQYSITALTNASGTILERYAYSAYGVPTITDAAGTVITSTAQNNRFLYTGREWDGPISLYHYRARMFDPQLGRFCSKDPVRYKGSKWNLFEYVGSSPTNAVDPLGLQMGVPFYDDWWDHYYNGNGEHFNLGDSPGIFDAWADSNITNGAIESAKGSIADPDPSALACGSTSISSYYFSYDVDYAPGNWQIGSILFPIGNTTLSAIVICSTTTSCNDVVFRQERACEEEGKLFKRTKCSQTVCQGFLILSDAFKDAKDIFDRTPGDQEFSGGTAYTFSAIKPFSYSSKKKCNTTTEWSL